MSMTSMRTALTRTSTLARAASTQAAVQPETVLKSERQRRGETAGGFGAQSRVIVLIQLLYASVRFPFHSAL